MAKLLTEQEYADLMARLEQLERDAAEGDNVEAALRTRIDAFEAAERRRCNPQALDDDASRSQAWLMVCEALTSVAPGWHHTAKLGQDAAVRTIRRLAIQTDAVHSVLAERKRQTEVEGHDPAHDDAHVNDEIAAFAALYAMPPSVPGLVGS